MRPSTDTLRTSLPAQPGDRCSGNRKPKLPDQLRRALRARHYSRRTEQTYCHWVKRFIILPPYPPPGRDGRAGNQRLPGPSCRQGEGQCLDTEPGPFGVVVPLASLMCGAGLRLMGCLRLRVQDVDFGRNEILVRDGKGAKDRITMLPISLMKPLQEVKATHEKDLADGWGRVVLPVLCRLYNQCWEHRGL